MPIIYQLDHIKNGLFLNLSTCDLNDANIDELIKILYRIQKISGFSNEQVILNIVQCKENLSLVAGYRFRSCVYIVIFLEEQNISHQNVMMNTSSVLWIRLRGCDIWS